MGQQLRQDDGFAAKPARVHNVQGYTTAPMRLYKYANVFIVVRPVRNHVGNIGVYKSLLDLWPEQHGCFICKAGDTPVGCHIDKDGIAAFNVLAQYIAGPGDLTVAERPGSIFITGVIPTGDCQKQRACDQYPTSKFS